MNYRTGDADGWAVFLRMDILILDRGQIGWRAFTANEFGYKIGDSIPLGTIQPINWPQGDVRDLCLSDSNIQLPDTSSSFLGITEFPNCKYV